ncbi:PREDICTED: uncharacterized protein LOC100635138 [Amphimedon queenslandica]|uniref:DUF4190 domain-containing protein n=1 Tax=Amphimedon queenslandica TaxID=400682 RepID=A0A1X7VK81_AMPQE|nr:PREDICTED: uncharacterized protein LOC100635138 [Amphimedon queenslandica]|eukprot:XP_003383912.1 PREDICTED: uncharacterized protein LOC100635138 [Amphimedon queenslandica]
MESEGSTTECIPEEDTAKLTLDPPPAYAPPPDSSSQAVQYFSQEQAAVIIPSQTQIPQYVLPDDYLILVSILTLLCVIVNVTSLIFGIPALYLSWQAYVGKREGLYAKTKRNGYISAILSLLNLLYTGCVTILFIGLFIGFRCGYGV